MKQWERAGAGIENKSQARAQALPATPSLLLQAAIWDFEDPRWSQCGVDQVLNWSWGSSDTHHTGWKYMHRYSRWHLKVSIMAVLPACQKFWVENNWLPKHQTYFSMYCVSPAPWRDVGKIYRSPCPPVLSPLPRWLMTLLSFSFPLEKMCWGGQIC